MDYRTTKYFQDFGYNDFGELILKFSIWLKDQCKHNNIEDIYFLSRDGYILKKAFDIINDTKIKTYYLYASRRATIVPTLKDLNNTEEIFDIFSFKKKFTVNQLLQKLGLEDRIDINILEKNNLKMDEIFEYNTAKSNKKLQSFLKDILPIVKANSKEEYKNLEKYLNVFNFKKRIAVVDIGWNGSIQKALEKTITQTEIFGYYIGLNPNSQIEVPKNANGFLFDSTHNTDNAQKIFSFTEIFEFLTLAHHGTVKKYIDSEESVLLDKYEYKNKTEEKISTIIQKSALDYVKENKNESNTDIDINIIFKKLLHPTFKDINFFGKLTFMDDKLYRICKPRSIFYYAFNIKELKKDYMSSKWKNAFMKKLIKLPLPYYFINQKLRKIYLGGK